MTTSRPVRACSPNGRARVVAGDVVTKCPEVGQRVLADPRHHRVMPAARPTGGNFKLWTTGCTMMSSRTSCSVVRTAHGNGSPAFLHGPDRADPAARPGCGKRTCTGRDVDLREVDRHGYTRQLVDDAHRRHDAIGAGPRPIWTMVPRSTMRGTSVRSIVIGEVTRHDEGEPEQQRLLPRTR